MKQRSFELDSLVDTINEESQEIIMNKEREPETPKPKAKRKPKNSFETAEEKYGLVKNHLLKDIHCDAQREAVLSILES